MQIYILKNVFSDIKICHKDINEWLTTISQRPF
jgi:hypothetical protein